MNYKENIKKERVLAVIIDAILILGITFILQLILGSFLGVEVLANGTTEEVNTLYLILSTIMTVLVVIVYQGYVPSVNNGQTLGKKHFKIKVINENRENPSFVVHAFRNVLWWSVYLTLIFLPLYFVNPNIFSVISGIIDYVLFGAIIISLIAYLINPDEGALHDKVFKTRVVDENYQFGLKIEEMSEFKEEL